MAYSSTADDEHAEPLLAAAQLVLDRALGRDVLHLEEGVEGHAGGVPDRRHGGLREAGLGVAGDLVLERRHVLAAALDGPQRLVELGAPARR